jgi:phosphatidylserine/phosphatidylglycerophosphate/cardiolipin synthase-like enzyme
LTVVTDLSRDNMLSGGIDVAALADLVAATPRSMVRFLPSLHAKVYIADESCAIVTSGNLTDSGLNRNFEYGVLCRAAATVRTIREDIIRYAALGSPIDGGQLRLFAQVAAEVRQIRQALERQVRARTRREFENRLREMDDEILGVRTAGRTAHAIFADTILHLLRRGPARTTELHEMVRRIHTDLCDDSVDRVIRGQHFGKKWKHAVRTAQVFLRRRGDIELRDGFWRLVTDG